MGARMVLNQKAGVLPTSRWFCVMVLCLMVCLSSSFSTTSRISRFQCTTKTYERFRSCLNTVSVASTDDGDKAAVIQDANGIEFSVGALVRVSAKGLKAYHINAKGFGSYDEDKKFVPASKDGGRATKNLIVPVGLRGKVTLIKDVNELSANLPIQVKFKAGENTDEGYDAPVTFTMHFNQNELECV